MPIRLNLEKIKAIDSRKTVGGKRVPQAYSSGEKTTRIGSCISKTGKLVERIE